MIFIDAGSAGSAIRALREGLGIPRRRLAAGVAAATGQYIEHACTQIWRWESGRSIPDLDSVARVFKQLGYRIAVVPIEEREDQSE